MRENKTLFSLGRLVATPAVLDVVSRKELFAAVGRHKRGDWGDVCETDRKASDQGLKNGERLLSAYKSAGGTKFWIVTEADWSYTTILLPSEY